MTNELRIEPPPTASRLRAAFDAPDPATVGVEEELMLLDPDTLDLLPRADAVLSRLAGDPRFKPELPAAQLELLSPPTESFAELGARLADGRRVLAEAAADIGLLAGAGTHPFTAPEGALNRDPRYRRMREEYGSVARRQLVCGLHVHVRIRGADRALAVYNSMRSFLGELAALAANAPLYAGRDSGLASVRPKIAELLPRQGVPPALRDLDELASVLRWGATSGTFAPRAWWWELRLNPTFGTLEARVPDQQSTAAETVAVAWVVHSLALHLARRLDAGEELPVHPGWQIAENRWSASRHGLDGTMVDLEAGKPRPTRERLLEILQELESESGALRGSRALATARELAMRNGATRQREIAREAGPQGVAFELANLFLG